MRAIRILPKPSSVRAKQPVACKLSIWSTKRSWCFCVPSFNTVPPKRLTWTVHFVAIDTSAQAQISCRAKMLSGLFLHTELQAVWVLLINVRVLNRSIFMTCKLQFLFSAAHDDQSDRSDEQLGKQHGSYLKSKIDRNPALQIFRRRWYARSLSSLRSRSCRLHENDISIWWSLPDSTSGLLYTEQCPCMQWLPESVLQSCQCLSDPGDLMLSTWGRPHHP